MANDRPIVVEMSQLRAPRETADNADKRDREWWAQCSPEELQHEASMMPLGELQATVGELNAAISSTATVVSDPQMTDTVWKDRARRALAHQRKARSIFAAEVKSRQDQRAAEKREDRQRIVAQARDCVADNNLTGAVMLMLQWIEGFGQKDPSVVRPADTSSNVQEGQGK